MRTLVKLVSILLLVGAVWFALGRSGWFPRIPAHQRVALERLRAPEPALPGRNAALAAYLISRGVPQAEWARFETMAPTAAVAELQSREPAPDPVPDAFGECQAWGHGCLARVRAEPDTARSLRDRLATRLDQIDALQRGYPQAALVGESNFGMPLPPFNGLHLPVRLDAALRHVDGEPSRGLQRLCEHARYWRGLRQRTDLLITDMIGVAYVTGAANTYAEMLADLPPHLALPDACADAFAPMRDEEFQQCRIYKTEFAGLTNTLRDRFDVADGTEPTWLRRALVSFGMRMEATLALAAPPYAAFCEAAHRERIARRSDMPPSEPDRCGFDGWVFNPFGCIVVGLGANYSDYYHRLLDLDGRLRLVSAAAWLRANAAADPAAGFAQRPEALRDPRHRIEGERCATVLRFEPRKARPQDAEWELVLTSPPDCAGAPVPAAPEVGAATASPSGA